MLHTTQARAQHCFILENPRNAVAASESLRALADAIETGSANRQAIVHQMVFVEDGHATGCCHLGAAYLSTLPDIRNLTIQGLHEFEKKAERVLLSRFPVLSSVTLVSLLDRHLDDPVEPDDPASFTLLDSIGVVNDETQATPSQVAKALRAVADDVLATQLDVDLHHHPESA